MHQNLTGLVFNEPGEIYHSKKEYINSTALKEMAKSPAHFKQAWTGPQKTSKAFEDGQLIHSAILEQDLSGYVARPEGVGARSKEDKAVIAELEATGKKVITAEMYASMVGRLDAFIANPDAMKLYNGAKVEVSAYGKDLESGLLVKARPDILGSNYIADFKTTANMGRFERDVFNYGYHIQLAHYSAVVEAATHGGPIKRVYIIAQEKEAPYGVKVFEFAPDVMRVALDLRQELLNRAAVSIEQGTFPSYDVGLTVINEIPGWANNQDAAIFEEAV
jgi:exodeoxyribonuclease VIII